MWHSDVAITTIGGISPVPLAEYVLFTILGFAHRLPAMLDVRQSRTWPGRRPRWQRFLPAPLAGATVGIVGYGRIGREIGRQAARHGMKVVGVNRSGRVPTGAERAARHFSARRQSSTGPRSRSSRTGALREVVGRVRLRRRRRAR